MLSVVTMPLRSQTVRLPFFLMCDPRVDQRSTFPPGLRVVRRRGHLPFRGRERPPFLAPWFGPERPDRGCPV